MPRAIGGSAVALDFACTSGFRRDRIWEAAANPEAILADYEEFKRNFIATGETETTEELCSRQGIRFFPMVVEAHGGGWSNSARKTLDCIAKHITAAWNTDGEAASLSIAQRLSTTLHRENARAVLKRLQQPVLEEVPSNAYVEGDESLW